MSKSNKKNWCFTSFPPLSRDIEFNREEVRYVVFQDEICPETKKPHTQGYIQFYDKKRLPQVKAILGEHVHVNPQWAERNTAPIEYCKKLDSAIPNTIYELGKPIKQGQRMDIEALKADILKPIEQIADKHLPVFLKYNINKYRNIKLNKLTKPVPIVKVITGEPGIGKTRSVYDAHPIEQIYSVPECNGTLWLDGYDPIQHKVVLFDDFNPDTVSYTYLLKLLDRYPVQVQVKGGFIPFIPEYIYITSNHDIEYWYRNTKALKRRIYHNPE